MAPAVKKVSVRNNSVDYAEYNALTSRHDAIDTPWVPDSDGRYQLVPYEKFCRYDSRDEGDDEVELCPITKPFTSTEALKSHLRDYHKASTVPLKPGGPRDASIIRLIRYYQSIMKRIHDWDNAINSMALNPSLPRPQIEPFPADIYNSNYAKVDASEMDPTDNSDRNESPGEVGSSDSAVPETRVLPRFKNGKVKTYIAKKMAGIIGRGGCAWCKEHSFECPYLPSTSAEGDDNEEDGDEVPNGYTVYIYFKDG